MTDKEKLEKIRLLSDKMYTSMQNLTTDTAPIRKAMDEYHQFIIYHWDEKEPVSKDLEEAAKKAATFHSHISGDKFIPNDYWLFKKGAQWQKEKMIDKACEWLKINYAEFTDNTRLGIKIDELIKDFKKDMEDEK